jgi:hypothetical protein
MERGRSQKLESGMIMFFRTLADGFTSVVSRGRRVHYARTNNNFGLDWALARCTRNRVFDWLHDSVFFEMVSRGVLLLELPISADARVILEGFIAYRGSVSYFRLTHG